MPGIGKRVLFLGMNPGPFGMVQTGVPFGELVLGARLAGNPRKSGPTSARTSQTAGYWFRVCALGSERGTVVGIVSRAVRQRPGDSFASTLW
jgi:hypothetical protein